MLRCLLFAVVSCCAVTAFAGPPVAETDPLPPAEQIKKFHLPPGFEIQLVASEPDIQKPMNLVFDARGRLWVLHSIEYPWAVPEGMPSPDGITILDGIGADGLRDENHQVRRGFEYPDWRAADAEWKRCHRVVESREHLEAF